MKKAFLYLVFLCVITPVFAHYDESTVEMYDVDEYMRQRSHAKQQHPSLKYLNNTYKSKTSNSNNTPVKYLYNTYNSETSNSNNSSDSRNSDMWVEYAGGKIQRIGDMWVEYAGGKIQRIYKFY